MTELHNWTLVLPDLVDGGDSGGDQAGGELGWDGAAMTLFASALTMAFTDFSLCVACAVDRASSQDAIFINKEIPQREQKQSSLSTFAPHFWQLTIIARRLSYHPCNPESAL
jgi:hypothetical protein